MIISDGIDVEVVQTGEYEFKANISVGEVKSEVYISCDTAEQAIEAVKAYHLPNMRNGERSMVGMVFEWEIPVIVNEPTEYAPQTEFIIPEETTIEETLLPTEDGEV